MTISETYSANEVLATLHGMMQASASDTARIQAAKLLLERIAPKEDDEARKRESEERAAALDEARGLLAEFTALKLAGLCEPRPLDLAGETATADAAGSGSGA